MKILATFGLVVLLAVTARAQNPDQFVAQIYRYQGGEKSEFYSFKLTLNPLKFRKSDFYRARLNRHHLSPCPHRS